MNRRLLKDESRRLIKTATPKPVIAAIILTLLLLAISILSARLIAQPIMDSFNDTFPELYEFSLPDGSFDPGYGFSLYFDFTDPDVLEDIFDAAFDAIEAGMPSPGAWLLYLLLGIVSFVLGIGFLIFTLNIAMGAEASYWNLLDGFPMILRLFVLEILKGLFIFLWTLLFVIPGFIAFYRYRQAEYLLVQHPEMTPMDCLRESKALMKGHKWELFVLDLSFLGWAILIGFANGFVIWSIPIIAVAIRFWFTPFLYLTRALYYKELTYVPPEEEQWVPEF